MHSLGKRNQLGATPSEGSNFQERNRASAQAGFISQLCRGQHSGLRPFASTQQPADFFCKEFLSGQHRLEDPISVSFSGEWFRGNRRPRRSRVCEPWRCFAVRDSEQLNWGHPSCKTWEVHSTLAHQFQGVEATADRHRTFNPTW